MLAVSMPNGYASGDPAGSNNQARITAYTYDYDHRTGDTVTGADTINAGPALMPGQSGTTSSTATGGGNTRTRKVYDADGDTVVTYAPRAFTASVTSPDPDFATLTTYDAAD